MSAEEVVKTDPNTGAKKAGNLVRASLIPPKAIEEIARHFGVGSLKYADHNWRRGYPWDWSYDALVRHLAAFWDGEDIDEQTGSKHIIAVAWHAIVLSVLMDEHPELDTRWATVKEAITNEHANGDHQEGD